MLNYIGVYIGSFISILATYYVSAKLLNQKIECNFRNIIILILETCCLLFLFFVGNTLVRLAINILLLFIANHIIFKKTAIKTLITSFMTFVIITLSELAVTCSVVFLYNINLGELKETYFISLTTNIAIAIVMVLFVNIKQINKRMQKILDNIYIKNDKTMFIIIFVSIFSLTLLFYFLYFQTGPVMGLILNLFLICGYTMLTLSLFREKNDNIRIQSEYDIIIENSDNYEKMLDIQRMRNHENNNVLISIRGMLNTKNKEAIEFINDVINDKKSDDQDLILKTQKIPTGGLQGLIYQKLLLMKQLKINYNVEINKEIKKNILKKMDSKIIKDICLIVGVFLDNSIQEVQRHKEKLIGIYIYCSDDNMIIKVSNSFKGPLEVEKINAIRYTTKNDGHGYGLALVEKIINSSDLLANEKSIDGNIFSQFLKIKLK